MSLLLARMWLLDFTGAIAETWQISAVAENMSSLVTTLIPIVYTRFTDIITTYL